MIRDQALFAAGLLTEKLGGPSVKPYQPAGLWKELTMQDMDYVQSKGRISTAAACTSSGSAPSRRP